MPQNPLLTIDEKLQAIRQNPTHLYALALRLVSRMKRPPTLDHMDMVQDAVVALLETIDSDRALPLERFGLSLALLLRARQRLGGRASYWAEWQWANRRIPSEDSAPLLAATEQPELPPATLEGLQEELVASVPSACQPALRLMLDGYTQDEIWRQLGVPRDAGRRLVEETIAHLKNSGLWDTCILKNRRRRL